MLNFEPTPKKVRPSDNIHSPIVGVLDLAGGSNKKRKLDDNPSPSKRRRLEEDGVVLMDGPDEILDSGEVEATDYIIIDDD